MTRGNIVEFAGVQKSYDGRHLVIHDLDLGVRHGEFLTLLGASGSGKTTTLMMLAGFETPTRGHILMKGVPIEHLPPHRRGIGVVFQNYALFPHMSVAQNLAYPLKMRGDDRATIAARVEKFVHMVRLEGMEHRRPSELSGGQQQRVALARALVFEPDLVLMDEPLGALDKALREHMQDEIRQIHRELGVTVVYVTHDQSEALAMSDRIAIFQDGRIAQIAAPEELYERPASTFVAGFIGENNLLAGRADGSAADGRCRITLASGAEAMAALPHNRALPTAQVTLAVRPERLAIGRPAELLANRLRGRITDVTYLGDHLRAQVDIGGGQRMIVRKPVDQFPERPAIGAEILVGWREEDGLVFS
ncbi:ABC transporter ATP-binding protein [Geminicoccus flavidas]|uniref:ABC transporter ATP-binding protein n=1 Tax=Geminicoccus flavidas TaxID=2506407 RepID=UPI00135699A4|nr:ABC transporter ATP-binding protein [Geminicoccus flavidas]